MNNIERKLINKSIKYWSRQILNFYWIIFILVVTLIVLNILDKNSDFYNKELFLKTGIFLFFTLFSTEMYVRYVKRYIELVIMLAGNIMAISLCLNNYQISFEEILLVIPIFAASIYFNIKYIYLATVSSILTFILLYFVNFNIQNKYDSIEFLVMISLFGFIGYLTSLIVNKGIDIIDITKKNIDTQEELLIKNIIIETNTKTDALTEIYNHITYQQYLSILTEMADKGCLCVHLALFDIDNFKSINDTFGHQFGDIVIKRLAETMREKTNDNDFLARYGGEELVILFIDKSDSEVIGVLEEIRKSFSNLRFTKDDNQKVTVSIGLKKYEKNTGKNVFFEETDKLLYKAKHSGKDCIVYDNLEVEVLNDAK